MNETTQQEKTTQLSSRNEQLNSAAGTKQLNSSVGTKQLNSTQQERNNSTLHCRKPPQPHKLNLQEILRLTWDLITGTKTCDIERKSGFSSATLADWRHFVHEQVLDHVELTSSKIGGGPFALECKRRLGLLKKLSYNKEMGCCK
ncbi:hypothetical protein TNCV_3704161 [Trichonephila clavipes]|nr:hypothetical protein TNCV_3704161 [Trichonephila clavipes]